MSFGAHDVVFVVLGAFAAGFTTGFAGFGTGLVSSGFWFHALPAPMVPPLVALASVSAHILGIVVVRRSFDWRRARPYLVGGIAGVPLGVLTLRVVSPDILRLSVGGLLVAYAAYRLAVPRGFSLRGDPAPVADGAVGAAGGFLGGFAGLSGPVPLIWLQLKGGAPDGQRAVYQPFNLVVLAVAAVGMAVGGSVGVDVLSIAALCLPATMAGSWFGVRLYRRVSPAVFQSVVLTLLLTSGVVILARIVW
jgi:uncharacterized membrane protein YfcA